MDVISIVIIIIQYTLSFILLRYLPDKIPMHWNIYGQVDNYMPKYTAVWVMPVISLLILILFRFLPLFDPNKKKYQFFTRERKIIQTVLISFFAYLQFVIFYSSLYPGTNIRTLFFIGLGILFILLGNYLSKIRQNYFIGIKIPWTLSSEDNWNKTHRYASWCFVIAGIIMMAEAYFIWYAPVIIFGSILIAISLPILYSFLLYKKSAGNMKYIYVILIILAGILFTIRLASGEDNWICKNGVWIKHGMPTAPKPDFPCLKK